MTSFYPGEAGHTNYRLAQGRRRFRLGVFPRAGEARRQFSENFWAPNFKKGGCSVTTNLRERRLNYEQWRSQGGAGEL